MKKITFITIFALATLPFSGCNSGSDQTAYMQSPKAEQNAREAEQAEEEFAQLAKQEVQGTAVKKSKKTAKTEKAEKASKHKTEKVAKAEKNPSAEHGRGKQEAAIAEDTKHFAEQHEASKHAATAEHKTPTEHKTVTQETAKAEREPASTPGKHVAQSSDKVWTVNLGAFKVKENATRLTAKLKTAGFPVLMRHMNHSKNGELFVVHLEPTPNKSEAQKWQTDLKLKSIDSVLTTKMD